MKCVDSGKRRSYSSVNPPWRTAWFDHVLVVLRGEWREKQEKIEKQREIDSSLQAEMIVLGKKQSVLIDFLCCLNGGCLSGSHYLPSDLAECLHVGMDSGAPLKMRINTRRVARTYTQAHARTHSLKREAPRTINLSHMQTLIWTVCVCVCVWVRVRAQEKENVHKQDPDSQTERQPCFLMAISEQTKQAMILSPIALIAIFSSNNTTLSAREAGMKWVEEDGWNQQRGDSDNTSLYFLSVAGVWRCRYV